MDKPNIFNYATSELSQDAVIAWLLLWGDPIYKEKNKELHQVGILLLDSLFEKFDSIEKPEKYSSVRVHTQYKKIDVFCIVNDKYGFIIEDKTNTKNHSDQLRRYYDEIKEHGYKNIVFEEKNILPVYFKTGDQSDYSSVERDGYKLYKRKDFLTVLNKISMINDILNDYKNYLQEKENRINSYKKLPINEWSYDSVQGFYMALKEELNKGNESNWRYVSQKDGGFYGFWWQPDRLKDEYRIYLQIEATNKSNMELKMVVKFAHDVKDDKIFQNWKKHIIHTGDIRIESPRRIRRGKTTTIGVIYNAFCNNEVPNVSETSKLMQKTECLLVEKIKTFPPKKEK